MTHCMTPDFLLPWTLLLRYSRRWRSEILSSHLERDRGTSLYTAVLSRKWRTRTFCKMQLFDVTSLWSHTPHCTAFLLIILNAYMQFQLCMTISLSKLLCDIIVKPVTEMYLQLWILHGQSLQISQLISIRKDITRHQERHGFIW